MAWTDINEPTEMKAMTRIAPEHFGQTRRSTFPGQAPVFCIDRIEGGFQVRYTCWYAVEKFDR